MSAGGTLEQPQYSYLLQGHAMGATSVTLGTVAVIVELSSHFTATSRTRDVNYFIAIIL